MLRRRAPAASPAHGREEPDSTATPVPVGSPFLLALLALAALFQLWLVRGLVRLPSPLFGGDLYYQMGCIRSIRATLDPMASCSVSGALPGYLPLYGTLVALLSRFTGLDVLPAMLTMAVALKTLSILLVFWVVARLFDRATAVLAAAFWYATHPGLIARYTDFAAEIVVPLYFFALIRFFLDPTARTALALGLAIALSGYSHAVVFLGSVFVLLLALPFGWLQLKDAPDRLSKIGRLGGLALLALGLAPLSLGYWFRPIFVHHGRTSLHYTEWNGGPSLISLADHLAFARDQVLGLVDFRGAPQATGAVLLGLGLAVLIANRNRSATLRVIGRVALATFAYGFHYFLTQPILGVNFVPAYVASMLWTFAALLVVAAALAAGLGRIGRPTTRRAVTVVGCAAFLVLAALEIGALVQSDAHRAARIPLHPMYTSLQEFVERDTDPNDVFLSANELSFALSALTGRKVTVTRRAQNDPFLDMDVRNRDAALILYGNDSAQRAALLQQYGIRYLLWTEEWASTEFYLDERGRVTDYDDPLLYFRNPTYDQELSAAGVSYLHLEGWVDPALRGERYRKFPLTIVSPANYRRPAQPWHPGLDPMLERAWSYEQDGREIAAIYRVGGPLRGLPRADQR